MLAAPHQKIAIVDLETTGVTATGDRITEIGIVLVVQGEVIEEWQTLSTRNAAFRWRFRR